MGSWASPLDMGLQVLDLSKNEISTVDELSGHLQSLTLSRNPSIRFAEDVLRNAVKKGVLLDLQQVRLQNSTEAKKLLEQQELRKTDGFTMIDRLKGFQCWDLANPSLRITPALFLPQELCQCLPGWVGQGADCTICPLNSFQDSNKCTPCPAGTTAEKGSSALVSCKCPLGKELFEQDGTFRCGCPLDHAVVDGACVKCEPLHLNCRKKGSDAASAQPEPGFARLGQNQTHAFQCLPPQGRCNGTARDMFGCVKGYTGLLCSECEAKHLKDGRLCTPCPESQNSSESLTAAGVAVAVVISAAALWPF